MKKLLFVMVVLALSLPSIVIIAGSKGAGDKCIADTECEFHFRCHKGVCVRKAEFDHGSGKTGQPCNIDADCIGSGKCVTNAMGMKYCAGE